MKEKENKECYKIVWDVGNVLLLEFDDDLLRVEECI
jgi:hypothetical protein